MMLFALAGVCPGPAGQPGPPSTTELASFAPGGLTPDGTYAVGTSPAALCRYAGDAVIATDLALPAGEGTLVEIGNSKGMLWIGLVEGGATFRVIVNQNSTGTKGSVADFPRSSFSEPAVAGQLVVGVTTGTPVAVSVHWKGVAVPASGASLTDEPELTNGSTTSGAYGSYRGNVPPDGVLLAWPGSLPTDLRVYLGITPA